MRDYVKFFAAFETNETGLADYPQFFACLTEQDAFDTAAGMTPLFPQDNIKVAPFCVRLHHRTDVFSQITGFPFAVKQPGQPGFTGLINWNFGDSGASELRGLGTNSSVEKAGFKKADFSGAGALLEDLAALPALAAQLVRQGRFRDAGIVLFQYREVIAGRISITAAIDFLSKSGLL